MKRNDIHDQHLEHQRQHIGWQDELRDWVLQQRTAVAKVQAFIKAYEAELDHQSDLIEAHELNLEGHEVALADSLSEAELERLNQRHQDLCARHALVEKKQDELRRRQAAMMTAFEKLQQT